MTAHPGAFCSIIGTTDTTKTGTAMICSITKPGERPRWRRNGPAPKRPSRRTRGTRPTTRGAVDLTTLPPVPAPAAAPLFTSNIAESQDIIAALNQAAAAPDTASAERILLDTLTPDRLFIAGAHLGVPRHVEDGPGTLAERYATAIQDRKTQRLTTK